MNGALTIHQPMPMGASNGPGEFPLANNNTWDAVRYWVGVSTRLKHADLACQVMAGFALVELKQASRVRRGRPEKEFPHDAGINGQPTGNQHRDAWGIVVARESGVSEDTAGRWMAMALGVRARWAKLPVMDRLSALMSAPPSQWVEADAAMIASAVRDVTDGKTQLDFMAELGICKRSHIPVNRQPASRKGIPNDREEEQRGIDHEVSMLTGELSTYAAMPEHWQKVSVPVLEKLQLAMVAVLADLNQVIGKGY
jgi:hypothetical protein